MVRGRQPHIYIYQAKPSVAAVLHEALLHLDISGEARLIAAYIYIYIYIHRAKKPDLSAMAEECGVRGIFRTYASDTPK
jgi:hypothetical protein